MFVGREQIIIADSHSTKIVEGNMTISHATAARAALMSRGISCQIMDRVFRRNVKKHIDKWRRGGGSSQGGGMEKIIGMMRERSDEFHIVSRMGAVEAISRIIKGASKRLKMKILNQISVCGLREATDSAYDRSLDERLELINRQNVLMEESRSFKREN